MAHLRCDFFSEALSLSTTMTVILPQQTSTQIGMTGRERDGAPPVLYLLHGLSDDDTIWLRRTSIERFVALRCRRSVVQFGAAGALGGEPLDPVSAAADRFQSLAPTGS